MYFFPESNSNQNDKLVIISKPNKIKRFFSLLLFTEAILGEMSTNVMLNGQGYKNVSFSYKEASCWAWQHTPIIPAFGRPRQENYKFQASLASQQYTVSKKKKHLYIQWLFSNQNQMHT
jgi:hypothetical protein